MRVLKLHIDRWSYYLGLVSAVIALVMRTFNAFGFLLPGTVVQGITIWYMSFFKGALLFLLINIATTVRVHLRMLAEQESIIMPTDTRVVASPTAKKFRTVVEVSSLGNRTESVSKHASVPRRD